MKTLNCFIKESYNKNYAFVRKTHKDGSDTVWWAIVKYLAKNGPSTKKEIWDGLGWHYYKDTLRGQHSCEIAAMSSAGIITFDKRTKKWSTDVDINSDKPVKPQKVDKLEKEETNATDTRLSYYKKLEAEGYKFTWEMMRWSKPETGSATEFYEFVKDQFYAPVNIDDKNKIVSCMAASFADLGC